MTKSRENLNSAKNFGPNFLSTLIDQLFSEDPQGDYYYYAEYGEEYGDYKEYGNYEETYNYEDASEGNHYKIVIFLF